MLTSPREHLVRKRGPSKEEDWSKGLYTHPDRVFTNKLLAIIVRGVKIGYQGPDQLLLNHTYPKRRRRTSFIVHTTIYALIIQLDSQGSLWSLKRLI